MADIFISYSQADRAWVETLARLVEKEGFSVWWDVKVLPGDEFGDLVVKEISSAKCVLVVWSEHSINSDWVYGEADEARRAKKLVPVLKDAVHLPTAFRKIHTADLSRWNSDPGSTEFSGLLDAIRGRVQNSSGSTDLPSKEKPANDTRLTGSTRSSTIAKYPQSGTSPALDQLLAIMNRSLDQVAGVNKVTLRVIAVATIAIDAIKYGSYFANPNFDFWNLYWLLSEWAFAVIFAIFAFSKRALFPTLVRLFLIVAVALNAEQIFNIFVPEGPPPEGTLPFFIAYVANFISLGLLALVQSSSGARKIRPFALVTIAYYLVINLINSTVTHGSDGIVWLLAAIMRHALEAIIVCAAPQQYERER